MVVRVHLARFQRNSHLISTPSRNAGFRRQRCLGSAKSWGAPFFSRRKIGFPACSGTPTLTFELVFQSRPFPTDIADYAWRRSLAAASALQSDVMLRVDECDSVVETMSTLDETCGPHVEMCHWCRSFVRLSLRGRSTGRLARTVICTIV